MTLFETINIFASVAAVVISLVAAKTARDANTKSEKQAKVSTLNNIFVNIDAARARLEDHISSMAALANKPDRNEQEDAQLEVLESILDSKIEGMLNAYDDACQRYLREDVDEEAFRDKYLHSIKELVEKYPAKFQDPITRFKNFVKVYRKWYL